MQEQQQQQQCSEELSEPTPSDHETDSWYEQHHNESWGTNWEVPQAIYDTSWPPKAPAPSTSPSHFTSWDHDTLPTPPSTDPIEPLPPANCSIYPLQTKPGYGVNVTTYNAEWPSQYEKIKNHLHELLTTSNPTVPYTKIEHIGSTSIPGLAAKPNIDILITLPNHTALTAAIDALDWEIPRHPPFTRYTRVPNGGGIQGRESYKLYVPEPSPYYLNTPERSVYLIDESEGNKAGKVQVRCYRSVRDTLRDAANADLLDEYAAVKIELGSRTYKDSITYSALKNDVVRKVLMRAGWTGDEIDEKERLSERVWCDDEPAY